MFESLINNLKHNLKLPLPGEEIQFEMAHINRERFYSISNSLSDYKPSAVLVLLYPHSSFNASVLLIERVTYDGHHSGQIALPGGKFELNDKDLQETALREFFEETGCNTTPEIIGKLTPVYIPVSKFMVQPYVAFVSQKPNFEISTHEVNELIEWPIEELLNPNTIKQTTLVIKENQTINTPYFDVNGKILWGATAMIVNELKYILKHQVSH